MSQPNIAFIGAGNIARAIISGMIHSGYPAEKITASARTSAHLSELQQSFNIAVTTNNRIAVENAEVIILAVKPVMIESVCKEIAPLLSNQLIISVAAGQSCAKINEHINSDVIVARAMPNTACLISKGAIGIFAGEGEHQSKTKTSATKEILELLFSSLGTIFWLSSEAQVDIITAVSGSGPAYYFYLTEALIRAAIDQGLDETTSRALVAQTAFGAAAMITESTNESVESLRKKVTSPKGTTEAAIKVFDEAQLMETVQLAVTAATNRANELSK